MADLLLATEYPPKGEAEETEKIIALLKKSLEKDYPAPKRTLRDAHPKQVGLVKAEFTVLDNIPKQYKVGVFKEAKTYKAWIRFSKLSNGPDISKDSRGMAIKLMGVPGEKILEAEKNETTQDFVFMSTQFFVTKDVAGFASLLKAVGGGKLKAALHFLTHPNLTKLFLKIRIKVASMFGLDWGSTTPYLLGDRAVKYAVLPDTPTTETIPTDKPADNYLTQRMAAHLAEKDANLSFYIQVQVDAEKMPIEDPRVLWDRGLSPFIKVASIRIMKQTFDSEAQRLYGDSLSFTPWHSLPEHRPMGGINRGRKAIYKTMSAFRHGRNNEVSKEPTDWIDF
jgi:hypothetical protein